MKPVLAVIALLAIAVHIPGEVIAQDEQKAVLITGASSGIGRNMAETLAAEGYYVYAGA
jgi:hypothetical protein